MEEYYMIEATLSNGVTKYLILREMRGRAGTMSTGLVVYDKWDDKKGALALLEFLNKGD